MAFKRSAVRSRLSPPNKKTRFGVSFCLVLTPLRPPLNLHQSGDPAFEKPHVERGNDMSVQLKMEAKYVTIGTVNEASVQNRQK